KAKATKAAKPTKAKAAPVEEAAPTIRRRKKSDIPVPPPIEEVVPEEPVRESVAAPSAPTAPEETEQAPPSEPAVPREAPRPSPPQPTRIVPPQVTHSAGG